ncbi:uncharacterized protein LOC126976339 isoform X4 [Leptidea sinapis]|uniref:uncharacterized protein LOC126976339 isoform X4 n=1 Tax=Leptidea sinapis TaxID=189913 RepID=UPI0021C3A5A0|nr:uncharacterized protein LOC126976339 isoform X4 [Leptidea sinapis]
MGFMKYYGATALLTLAVIAECFGAHERSRQRSGSSRSVPVANNKREVDFDCPEEFGYYPHPTDCTLYYVCVFGSSLLESCTGGLMYSHELQTCDWPRNVGCDATGAVVAEDLGRLNERQSAPSRPAPRRNPPPARTQPNPVITSRGQPKYSRQEYEKQQQLYAEVDDLPPVEEIETDRQQRVYRGQPSTIGQVQKDRDGYISQGISSSRTLNANIIPASINQNSKLGSFSFGTQVDERRAATITTAPQTYSLEPTERVTPTAYSASPRPKMLYNSSQAYSPDQYDPYYAVYDEDGELYKDPDYVQQYNPASLRPAVQQTYRGTPPPTPSRRPVESYTPRPVLEDDYDDALIQGEIPNQNQYQTAIRQQIRLSTDEKPLRESYQNTTNSTTSSTFPTVNYLSSLAKPFERTDNVHRLNENLPLTESIPTLRPTSRSLTNNKNNLEIIQSRTNDFSKKMVALTTGFSIRHNINNTKNPYTLTVITKPFEAFNYTERSNSNNFSKKKQHFQKYYFDTEKDSDQLKEKLKSSINHELTYKEDMKFEKSSTDEITKPEVRETTLKPNDDILVTTGTSLPTTTETTKYYLKTVIKRPASPVLSRKELDIPTEANINREYNLNNDEKQNDSKSFQVKTKSIMHENLQSPISSHPWDDPVISPYETLDNLRNKKGNVDPDYSLPTTSQNTILPKDIDKFESIDAHRKPSYYTYHVFDEDISDQTTEILSSKIKNIIKTFFDNDLSTTLPPIETLLEPSPPEPKEVYIGFQNKQSNFVEEKPLQNFVKHLQIITSTDAEEAPIKIPDSNKYEYAYEDKNLTPDLSIDTNPLASQPIQLDDKKNISTMMESSTNHEFINIQKPETHESKFTKLATSKPQAHKSRKYYKLVNSQSTPHNKLTTTTEKKYDETTTSTKMTDLSSSSKSDLLTPIVVGDAISDIASTTSTTKSTTTIKNEIDLTLTKSIPFPTRASRINPAIKLAAANLGGGRRSYQSSSNCSTDNGLQANPKCNEIKYQRPVSTRGRGSSHYSTLGVSESPQPAPNRGTPPTRMRPTLKPSTAIVSKTTEFVDIYANPPRRPGPVYPTPTPDKTAAKCRKDVCLLPDCFCGGKDIPGDMPVESVPQIVLLTFDDSVNDLNKGLYSDLFEKGRVNPNGCPISATFYVSHEWTDYSQVQNLYSAGHEMASHTISHSFGEQFSQKKWNREVSGQRELLAAYGGVKLEDVRGMRAPFLSVGGNKMFKMLYDSNFTYDSSLPVYENKPPSWPYTLDYKLFHDCMIPPCPTKSYPGVWEVPMVMWQDLNGGRCSMGDACANPPEAENVYKMILKNFDRHYTSNRAPFGLFYHAAWFTQAHHKEGFIMFLDFINKMKDVWIITNWQALQWVRDPTPISRLNSFQPFQCNYQDRPKKCNNPKVCNLWHKSGVRYMRTCQPCPEIYPWTGKSGIRSSRVDNELEEK